MAGKSHFRAVPKLCSRVVVRKSRVLHNKPSLAVMPECVKVMPLDAGELATEGDLAGGRGAADGMMLFLLATVSLRDTERHRLLLIAGAGAVAICGVVIVVLTGLMQRPMVELQEQIERVGAGDMSASVSFAKRNDEIGDLGRNFNLMVSSCGRAAKKSNTCIVRRCRARNTLLR